MLFVLMAFLLMGCSSTSADEDEVSPEEALQGSWLRIVDLTQIRLVINADGTFTVSYDDLTFEGDYQFDANGLLVVRDMGCGTLSGVYSMTFTEESRSLILGLVEDNCRTRLDRWRGTWTRVGTSR